MILPYYRITVKSSKLILPSKTIIKAYRITDTLVLLIFTCKTYLISLPIVTAPVETTEEVLSSSSSGKYSFGVL